ncbi:hypothetical protein PRIPAC_77818 [Pristionchus pacificus]|uniref:Uncharacterized protein n=1 Tax=Pristionchus pacificus TaxID=54126 RepID=A0A2A6CN79_PRIPA|nr:hypothetical protein PRIPAC_77818 [Pristionchus pacificus]|eukprot:PDM79654.1 hypothetical protein PRIPAC_32233 [Pristionchus pacificus]
MGADRFKGFVSYGFYKGGFTTTKPAPAPMELAHEFQQIKLLDLSYERARLLEIAGAFAECTSIASQKLFAKIGYQVLREIRLDEFLGDDGKPVRTEPILL